MTYVETSRTIEPHSECILFLHLRDANGAPVPNARIKIWAGPPPVGQPPYFTDDDPDNPNRLTDANGKFQFVVANPAPDRDLDFFVAPAGPDGQPQAEPIHFPFPARTAQWVMVTAAPPGVHSERGEGELAPVPALDLDPRLASVVNVSVQFIEPSANPHYWKLISARYLDPDESSGNVTIVCYVQDERGQPLPGARVVQRWPGDQATAAADERGHAEFPMTGDSSFDPARGEHGPYSALVDGLPSDTVLGMGLPLRRHVQYVLTWRRVSAEGIQPEMRASGSVTGQIRGASAGAQLTLSSAGSTVTSTLGPDGAYGFSNLPAGSFVLTLGGVGIISSSLVLDGKGTLRFDYVVPARPAPKVFAHYLLFGPGNQAGTMTNLILSLDYIIRFAPLVGFSVDEAKNAHHVTIVGDAGAVSAADEAALREVGCQVVRLTAPDSYALENLIKQVVASGSPYPR